MKRYRFTGFFIDGTRNILRKYPAGNEKIKRWIASEFGESNFNSKLERYLAFDPPNIFVLVEYYDLLLQIAYSYVSGYFYPALTGACCLGERIFNMLIINLRDFYKDTNGYKKIYSKDSIQDWNLSIDVLTEWNIIDSDLEKDYRKLGDIRNDSIHLKEMSNIPERAIEALRCIMKITERLFGLRQDIFFMVSGEPYIRKNKENEPIVKKFLIPNCILVGHKHIIEEEFGESVIKDTNQYEDGEVTDSEFSELRQKWLSPR